MDVEKNIMYTSTTSILIVRYVSYFSHITGRKQEVIPEEISTVEEIIVFLSSKYEELRSILEERSPEVSMLIDGRAIVLPQDAGIKVREESLISPIIAGG